MSIADQSALLCLHEISWQCRTAQYKATKSTQADTPETTDLAAVQLPFRVRYTQSRVQPPSQTLQHRPASRQNPNHLQKHRTIACRMDSTSCSTTNLNLHPHHHLDEHPHNPATTSTSDNNPSPHEPAAPATETAAQSTRPQSSRSSSQTSTPNPKTIETSYKTPASPWAVSYSRYQIPPAGPSSQKQNHPSETETETEIEKEKEKTTASPAQTTHSSPPSSPAKPSCPPFTSTQTQTPTPRPPTPPRPPSSQEHHQSLPRAPRISATPQNCTNQPPSSSSPICPSARRGCTGSSSGL